MKQLAVGLMICLMSMIAPASVMASAVEVGIPSPLYPRHTLITFLSDATNTDIDVNWGFSQEGDPVFHTKTQDQLRRVGGWFQAGTFKHGDGDAEQDVEFVCVYSTYHTANQAESALMDFEAATTKLGYKARTFPDLGSSVDASYAALDREPPFSVYSVAYALGTAELELAVLYQRNDKAGNPFFWKQALQAQVKYMRVSQNG